MNTINGGATFNRLHRPWPP